MSNNWGKGKNRIQDQSNEEWVRDYDGHESETNAHAQSESTLHAGNSVISLHPENRNPSPSEVFRFLDFRTFRTATYTSVALELESIDGLTRATAFFGVKLNTSRGTMYEPGLRGQFIPPEHGNFIKFWMQVVGEEPSRWCRVHKSMRSKLKDKLFTGNLSQAVDRKGVPYMKLNDLRKIEQAQIWHN